MALFPSYGDTDGHPPLSLKDPSTSQGAPPIQEPGTINQDWLQNPSFKPDVNSINRLSSSSSDSEVDILISLEDKRKKKRKRTEKQKHSKSKLLKQSNSGSDPIITDNTGNQGKDVYQIDVHSAPSNLQYDTLYSGDVSIYRRRFVSCLGLKKHQSLQWKDGRSKATREKKVQVERYFKGNHRILATEVGLPIATQNKQFESNMADFIGFEERKADAEKDGNDILTAEQLMSQHTGKYNRLLLEDPHNVPLWMEFISFQDEMVEFGQGAVETADVNVGRKHRALSERKVAIFERALESNPTSEELLIGHMRLVQETWEPDRVLRRWKDLVFQQPNNSLLWINYIHYCQTSFPTFTTSSVIAIFTKCISTFCAILEGTLKSHPPLAHTLSHLIDIFVVFCQFLRHTGRTERAVACFQALIEFNLCSPAELFAGDLPTKARLQFFEPFWTSGVPRFGEPDSPGWHNWMRAQQQDSSTSIKLGLIDSSFLQPGQPSKKEDEQTIPDDPELTLISDLPVREAWMKLEEYRTMEHVLPWRPDEVLGETEEDCTDPDRIVMFDDINKILFKINDPSNQIQLILAFLHFLGAPSQYTPSLTIPGSADIQVPSNIDPWDTAILSNILGSFDFSTSLHQPQGVGISPFNVLSTDSIVELADTVSKQLLTHSVPVVGESQKRGSTVCDIISTVCNQALSVISSHNDQTKIIQIWMAYNFTQIASTICNSPHKKTKAQIKATQKLVKNLLRIDHHHNNLSLWNSYALLEHLLGNTKEASKLYQTILTQYPVPNAQICCNMFECLMGIQETLHAEPAVDTALALHVLVCLSEKKYIKYGDSVSPARILKARSNYEELSLANYAVEPDGEIGMVIVYMMCCHAYLEYLTRGIEKANCVFDKWTSSQIEQQSRFQILEHAYLKQCKLLLVHSKSHPSSPALLRGMLERALASFPNHSLFLTLFIQSEQQSFISGRLRRYFDHHAPKSRTAMPWLYAVCGELQRYLQLCSHHRDTGTATTGLEDLSVGTLHRIAAVLSRATSSDNGRHCPLLWRMYMAFMVHYKPNQVMGVFYQAIHNCPWSKVLCYDIIQYQPSELQRVMELLEDKEIRLYAPLEEIQLLLQQ